MFASRPESRIRSSAAARHYQRSGQRTDRSHRRPRRYRPGRVPRSAGRSPETLLQQGRIAAPLAHSPGADSHTIDRAGACRDRYIGRQTTCPARLVFIESSVPWTGGLWLELSHGRRECVRLSIGPERGSADDRAFYDASYDASMKSPAISDTADGNRTRALQIESLGKASVVQCGYK